MPTQAALRAMFAETKDTLDHQVQTAEGLDDKAATVFKFDVLIVGLVATAVSIVVSRASFGPPLQPWVLVCFAMGFGGIIISALAALWAFQVTKVRIGLRAEDLVEAVDDEGLNEPTLYREAIVAYGNGMIANALSIEATASRLQVATWSLWLGILLLATATMGLSLSGANMGGGL